MSLSLRDRLRTMLELSEHATDDEICQVVGAKQTERDALAHFRQAVVEALPDVSAGDSDDVLLAQVRALVADYQQKQTAAIRQNERARLAKDIYLRSISTLGSVTSMREEEAVRCADALLAALERDHKDDPEPGWWRWRGRDLRPGDRWLPMLPPPSEWPQLSDISEERRQFWQPVTESNPPDGTTVIGYWRIAGQVGFLRRMDGVLRTSDDIDEEDEKWVRTTTPSAWAPLPSRQPWAGTAAPLDPAQQHAYDALQKVTQERDAARKECESVRREGHREVNRVAAERDEIAATLADVAKAKAAAEDERDAARNTIERLREICAGSKDDIDKAQFEAHGQAAVARRVAQERDEARRALADMEDLVLGMRQERDAARAALDALRAEHTATVQGYRAEVDAARVECDVALASGAAAEQVLYDLTRERDEARALLARLTPRTYREGEPKPQKPLWWEEDTWTAVNWLDPGDVYLDLPPPSEWPLWIRPQSLNTVEEVACLGPCPTPGSASRSRISSAPKSASRG